MKRIKKERQKLLFIVLVVVFVAIIWFLFCKKNVVMNSAVKDYLATANFEWEWQEIKKWDEIVVDYIWRLKDGIVFDTSVESVAKGSDKYNEHRDYDEWLSFTVWAGQMIAGFDRGVEGMKIWQTKTIEIPAIDAYGERNEENVISVPKSQLQLPWQYKEWEILYAPNDQSVKIHKVTDTEVFLDMNHELAGKVLIFDITIKEIK